MILTGISKIDAADVALCTSGVPQISIWTLLGRPGGSSSQDSQAKTRVCRGSPQIMIKQTQPTSKPCLQKLAAAHGHEQQNIELDVQSSADGDSQGLHAGTSQLCKDLQQMITEVMQDNLPHKSAGGFRNCHPGHQTSFPGHHQNPRCNC